jgi:hypothetical protein
MSQRIPKVIPNAEELKEPTFCHNIGDAMMYWHEQTTRKCIGVVIAPINMGRPLS